MDAAKRKDDSIDRRLSRPVKLCILLAIVLIATMVVVTAYDHSVTAGSPEWSNPGIRGDFIGGHLAAGASLAGTLLFFAAILMQRDELAIQRRELRESREVSKEQARALNEQSKELKRQNEMLHFTNSVQLLITLANEINNCTRADAIHAWIRLSADRITRTALLDERMSFDLLSIFAHKAVGRGTDLVHQLEDLCTNFHPSLQKKVGDKSWFDRAEAVVRGDYAYRHHEELPAEKQ